MIANLRHRASWMSLLFMIAVQAFAETVDLEGVPIRTINLEGLLRTKQTMRDKDMVDRLILERALATFRTRANDRKPGDGP